MRPQPKPWQAAHPDGVVTYRDLAADPVPHVDATSFFANFVAPADRIVVPGVTLGEAGGTLGAEKLVLTLASGGGYGQGTPREGWDHREPWLRHIDRTNLVGLLNELEQEQLIERRRAAEDRRRHVHDELTAAGREKLAQAELVLAAVEDNILAGLDRDQRETLYQLLLRASGELTEVAVRSGAALPPARCSPTSDP